MKTIEVTAFVFKSILKTMLIFHQHCYNKERHSCGALNDRKVAHNTESVHN